MNNLPTDIKISIVLAIILMVAVVMFLLFVIVLYSRKQVLFDKEKELRKLDYEKEILQKEINYRKKAQLEQERISHDLHDDVGSGISALRLQTEFIKKKTTDSSIAPNIEELLETCDELNVSMRQILWNLKVGDDNLDNFTDRMIHYTKTFFAKTDIKAHVFKEEVGYDQISADTRRNLFLCIKEALNNVYKHSNCQNIEAHFTKNGKFFTVDIIDDGVGMKDLSTVGDGLENMKGRMATLCGDLKFVPSEKGLHVKLTIDLEQEKVQSSNDRVY